MMRKFKLVLTLLLTLIILSTLLTLFLTQQVSAASFACGADVSWLPQMEAMGYKFYDDNGTQKDCLEILKEHGIDSIRLRVWVDPSNDNYSGHCSKNETVNMAVRAKNMGFRIMIDFHYSDSWADPSKQTKPAAWKNHNLAELQKDVYDHTYDVLNALKSRGVTPEWVQVGNETNNGMLWEEGKASTNMKNFTLLINSGYDAVKSVFSSAKVIVHISNGYDNSLFRWIFDGLKNNGGKYDVIAMSIYPESSNWSNLNSQCLTNMKDMVSRYGKEIIISEVGMSYNDATSCKSFISDIITKTKSLSGGKGLGVFYWEPQCYNWAGYTKGAWNTNGRPSIALDAFIGAGSGITTTSSQTTQSILPSNTIKPTSSIVTTTNNNQNSLTADYKIQNDWGSGSTVIVTIINNSSAAINNWTVSWSFSGNQKIDSIWNAAYTQNGCSVTVKNISWNGSIPANNSTSFGFNLSYSGTNALPTNIIVK